MADTRTVAGSGPSEDLFPLLPDPLLPEGEPLAAERINGVERGQLTLDEDGDAVITFVTEGAGFDNTLGVYLIEEDGTIGDTAIVFPEIEAAEPVPGLPEVRPGGGPLLAGQSLALSDLPLLTEVFEPSELEPGTEFGLFLIQDGANRIDPALLDNVGGTLRFVDPDDGGRATVTDTTPVLQHVASDGTVTTIEGPIFHALDGDLNPGGAEQVVSGSGVDGGLLIGFEDLVRGTGGSDDDFNDVVVRVDGGDALALADVLDLTAGDDDPPPAVDGGGSLAAADGLAGGTGAPPAPLSLDPSVLVDPNTEVVA